LKKLIASAVHSAKALLMARRGGYHVIHAVEESSFAALVIRLLLGIPYIYDMDSCLSEQFAARFPRLGPLARLLAVLERAAIRHAESVVAVCDSLADAARMQGARRVTLLRDVSLLDLGGRVGSGGASGFPAGDGPVVMYVGNLEPYQGVDLLLESFALARASVPRARLVVIGGQPADVHRLRERAGRLGIGDATAFVGPRPVAHLASCFAEAAVLVSPRRSGGNTPMKIYSYLHSGKAVLATDLPTHTQVLTPEIALLAPPEPRPFADAMVCLLVDAGLRERLGSSGRAWIERRHSYRTFRAALGSLYDEIGSRLDPAAGAAAVPDAPAGA
jgi:glycosyltransferase involved in cell wall biosynthesis